MWLSARLPDGLTRRGDINVLLLGDPGTAKSQLLKFVENCSPIGVSLQLSKCPPFIVIIVFLYLLYLLLRICMLFLFMLITFVTFIRYVASNCFMSFKLL